MNPGTDRTPQAAPGGSQKEPTARDPLVWLSAIGLVLAAGLHLGLAITQPEHAPAHAILFVIAAAAQALGALALLIRPSPQSAWAAIGLNGGLIVLWAATRVLRAPFTPHPEELDAAGLLTKSVEMATLALLALVLRRLAQPSRPKYARIIGRAAALGILTGGLLLLAGYALEPALPSLAGAVGEAGHEESATTEEHSSGEAHQATFRVRLSRQRVGPYLVDAFTGLTEVGDLFVEVGVRNPAGAVQGDMTVSVQAAAADGTGAAIGGVATSAGAQVPGNYAIHLPVTSAGFWDVTLTIDGPLGHADAEFTERVGGTANIAMWVLAGVPLAVALLFGFVYVRTAGRRRS